MTAVSVMPDRIGRFRLRSMLSRSAMGVVYLGHDEDTDRLVAIKLIRADLLDTEERESYLKRFRNEAKIAGRCMHANIVSLYDFAMHDDNPYLVMEYVNGVGCSSFSRAGRNGRSMRSSISRCRCSKRCTTRIIAASSTAISSRPTSC